MRGVSVTVRLIDGSVSQKVCWQKFFYRRSIFVWTHLYRASLRGFHSRARSVKLKQDLLNTVGLLLSQYHFILKNQIAYLIPYDICLVY